MAMVDPLMSSQVQPEIPVPLPLKMMSAMPSMSQMVALNRARYANTMFNGGFADLPGPPLRQGRLAGLRGSIGRSTGSYVGNTLQESRPFAQGVLGKMAPKLTGRAANAINPLSIFRFDSVARLTGIAGDKSTPYTPFQGTAYVVEKLFGGKASKRIPESFRNRFDADIAANPDKPLYAGGVLGRLNTLGKATAYERSVERAADIRARVPQEGARTRAQARAVRRGDAAAAKLSRLDENIMKVARQSAQFEAKARIARGAATVTTPFGAVTQTIDQVTDEIMRAKGLSSVADVKRMGYLESIGRMAGGTVGENAFKFLGVMSGAGKKAETETLQRAGRTITKFLENNKLSVGATGALQNVDDYTHGMRRIMGTYGDEVVDLLKTGNTRAIRSATGKLAMKAAAAGQRGTAAKLAGTYLSTYSDFAGKAFGAFGTASLVYDIGKGLGNLMMGGVNLAKDAVKSFQGSINKPLFGAGFKDNEVAATSRARGVMAIQNSRLNARSMLGSESSMLAAHFG